jgi:hypothetical protein
LSTCAPPVLPRLRAPTSRMRSGGPVRVPLPSLRSPRRASQSTRSRGLGARDGPAHPRWLRPDRDRALMVATSRRGAAARVDGAARARPACWWSTRRGGAAAGTEARSRWPSAPSGRRALRRVLEGQARTASAAASTSPATAPRATRFLLVRGPRRRTNQGAATVGPFRWESALLSFRQSRSRRWWACPTRCAGNREGVRCCRAGARAATIRLRSSPSCSFVQSARALQVPARDRVRRGAAQTVSRKIRRVDLRGRWALPFRRSDSRSGRNPRRGARSET